MTSRMIRNLYQTHCVGNIQYEKKMILQCCFNGVDQKAQTYPPPEVVCLCVCLKKFASWNKNSELNELLHECERMDMKCELFEAVICVIPPIKAAVLKIFECIIHSF